MTPIRTRVPSGAPAGRERELVQQGGEQGGLAAAVVAGQRDPVAARDGQVDRAEPEVTADHLGPVQRRHDLRGRGPRTAIE